MARGYLGPPSPTAGDMARDGFVPGCFCSRSTCTHLTVLGWMTWRSFSCSKNSWCKCSEICMFIQFWLYYGHGGSEMYFGEFLSWGSPKERKQEQAFITTLRFCGWFLFLKYCYCNGMKNRNGIWMASMGITFIIWNGEVDDDRGRINLLLSAYYCCNCHVMKGHWHHQL